MARRRMNPSDMEMSNMETAEVLMNPAETSGNDKRRRPRVIIPLNADGTPDLSRVDPVVLDAIKSQAETETAPDPIKPEVVEMAIMMIANIESAIVSSKFDIPQQEALAVIVPQPPIKTQLAEAGARVLSKYSGAMGKYQDEIVLGALLLGWQIGVINQIRALKAMKEAQKAEIIQQERKEKE